MSFAFCHAKLLLVPCDQVLTETNFIIRFLRFNITGRVSLKIEVASGFE